MKGFWIAARRSLWPSYLPLFTAVVVVSCFARDHVWRYEWLWASDTVAFSVVFIGPLCAGAAAMEVARYRHAWELFATSPREVAPGASVIAPVWMSACAAGVVGQAAVSVAVLTATTDYLPSLYQLLPLVLYFGMTLMWTCVGALAGVVLPSRATAALVAIGAFGLTMGAYIVGDLEPLVGVGGATGSLVGLALHPQRVAVQLIFYVALAATALLSLGSTSARSGAVGAARMLGASVVVAAATATLLVGSNRFVPHEEPRICTSGVIDVCVARGYALLDSGVAKAQDYVAAMEVIGAKVPSAFVQGASADSEVASLPTSAITTDPADVGWALLNWFVKPSCDLFSDESTMNAYNHLATWLFFQVDGVDLLEDPAFDVAAMDESERAEAGRSALETVERCGT